MNRKRNLIFPLIVAALALAAGACSSEKDKDSSKKAEPTAKEEPGAKEPAKEPAKATADPAAELAAVGELMKPYEDCRALLAADKGDGVADCAKAIEAAANKGKASVSDKAKPHLEAIAAAAGNLASAAADDIAALRLAYGEVSKPVVALLGASPEAAAKYHVFECPMAKGYKRWAQPDAKLSNPYMGTAMLTCGSEVK